MYLFKKWNKAHVIADNAIKRLFTGSLPQSAVGMIHDCQIVGLDFQSVTDR
jgi:hypothetical protein